jgi:hypothetical protein
MAIRWNEGYGQDSSVLTACPACDYEFQPEERRHVHLSTHSPEDFGLKPLGERNQESLDPLFIPIEELPEPRDTGLPLEAGENSLAAQKSAVHERAAERRRRGGD